MGAISLYLCRLLKQLHYPIISYPKKLRPCKGVRIWFLEGSNLKTKAPVIYFSQTIKIKGEKELLTIYHRVPADKELLTWMVPVNNA